MHQFAKLSFILDLRVYIDDMNDGEPAAAHIFAVLVENIRLLFPQALGIHPFAFRRYPRHLVLF